MSKLLFLVLIIVILATNVIAEANQLETIEVQQESNSIQPAEVQQTEANNLRIYNSLDNKIIELEKYIGKTKEEFDKKLNFQIRCSEAAMNSVNNSISGASYALAIFGIIVVFLGVILGIYISIQVRNVTRIAKQSKGILDTHFKIEKELKELEENIKNNMSKLYNDLKEEETKSLLERLCEVPEDIINLFHILASRKIPKKYFSQMKKAYQSLPDDATGEHAKYSYNSIFFQHFPDLAIFDEDLQNEMENKYSELMAFSFKNDIINASEDFIKVTVKEGEDLKFREKIKKYFIALEQSKFAKNLELHKHIYKVLDNKENRFNLYSILLSMNELKDVAKLYGQHLLSDYKNARNSDAENKMLIDVTKAIETKKEDSEPGT